MPIPTYKQINISSNSKLDIFNQLNQHQFGQIPHILNILELKNQEQVIEYIIDYIKAKPVPTFPYQINIITNIEYVHPFINCYPQVKNCPQFFQQKIKTLNVKEQNLMQKIYLLQKSLSNLNYPEHFVPITNYASGQKMIKRLCSEGLYLENLLHKLGNDYE